MHNKTNQATGGICMGADFLYQLIPAVKCSTERQKSLEAFVRQLSGEDLAAFAEECGGGYDPDDSNCRGKLIEQFLGDVQKYWKMDERRDASILCLSSNQPSYFISGGLSWGDGPTATFDLMERLLYIPGLVERLKAWAEEDLVAPRTCR